ncbi:hypothetical protein [Anaerovorax sp. IOR16]|nr:hypothetical protein [Anaerovorax sp. IOR16]
MKEIIEALKAKCKEMYESDKCNECPCFYDGDCVFKDCYMEPYRWDEE